MNINDVPLSPTTFQIDVNKINSLSFVSGSVHYCVIIFCTFFLTYLLATLEFEHISSGLSPNVHAYEVFILK